MDITNLYSEKVLEHFKNPRNMGEMKDADGVATVGNPTCGDIMRMFIKIGKREGREYIQDVKFQTLGCLPAKEQIALPEGGWSEIINLDKNSKVLNGVGEETFIVKTYARQYTGGLLTIIPFVSPFNSFSLTPGHPVFCVKRKWLKRTRKSSFRCDWLRINEDELLSTQPDYVKAGELEKGDFLVFSFNRKIIDNRFYTLKIMKLLGYYLAEGYITAGSVINFSFNKNEKKLIEQVRSLIFGISGKNASERTRGNVTEIRFCSKKWADFFYSAAGRLARKKTLSLSILLLPFKKQWELVKTYLLGDGDVYRRRVGNSKTYRAITASRNLAIQLQEILARGGIFASLREIFKTNCEIEGRKLKDSLQYLVSFKLQRKHNFIHKNKNHFLVPIKRIEKKNFRGAVYNFQVASDPNSYLVRGFAVHNCGAAIATSSIATEMIKGKSLKEALDLTNKAVAEALGGLPPIKMHCSVLAEEAVQKAIEDYQKKKTGVK